MGRDGNRPERVIHEITDAGAEALTDRLRELVTTPVNEFPQFVAALAEIRNLNYVMPASLRRSIPSFWNTC